MSDWLDEIRKRWAERSRTVTVTTMTKQDWECERLLKIPPGGMVTMTIGDDDVGVRKRPDEQGLGESDTKLRKAGACSAAWAGVLRVLASLRGWRWLVSAKDGPSDPSGLGGPEAHRVPGGPQVEADRARPGDAQRRAGAL